MNWEIPALARIIPANIIGPLIMKYIVNPPQSIPLAKKVSKQLLALQFFFCFVLSGLFLLVSVYFNLISFSFSPLIFAILGIGLLNSFAAYCQRQAVAISLAQASLFLYGDDLIAMALGYCLLYEYHVLSAPVIVGVFLCFCATILIFGAGRTKNKTLLGYVLGYCIIWGFNTFIFR